MGAASAVFLAALVIVFVLEMRHSLQRSTEINRLINCYIDDLHNKKLIDEIYAFCTADYKLRGIIKKHRATPEDIDKIYKKLLLWGNFKKGRSFVPISSFFFRYSLNYLLEHKNGDAKELTMKMMNFFRI